MRLEAFLERHPGTSALWLTLTFENVGADSLVVINPTASSKAGTLPLFFVHLDPMRAGLGPSMSLRNSGLRHLRLDPGDREEVRTLLGTCLSTGAASEEEELAIRYVFTATTLRWALDSKGLNLSEWSVADYAAEDDLWLGEIDLGPIPMPCALSWAWLLSANSAP